MKIRRGYEMFFLKGKTGNQRNRGRRYDNKHGVEAVDMKPFSSFTQIPEPRVTQQSCWGILSKEMKMWNSQWEIVMVTKLDCFGREADKCIGKEADKCMDAKDICDFKPCLTSGNKDYQEIWVEECCHTYALLVGFWSTPSLATVGEQKAGLHAPLVWSSTALVLSGCWTKAVLKWSFGLAPGYSQCSLSIIY